ncbi:MAG: hypothetical protein HYS07_09295 [Chlamydiae bacterium]|nr:hypothetical protein [Chlamydiota bacterium]
MTWSKQQIQKARKVYLAPLLAKRGFSLRKLEYDNFAIDQFPGVVIKYNFFFHKFDRSRGNSIDFFIRIQHKSFHEAMTILIPHG